MPRVRGYGALALLGMLTCGGCELVTSFEARIVDAGPDAVPGGCFSDPACVECDPVSPTSCPSCDGGTCPGCDGGDCDPLRAERDPWPTVCNELQLAEGFSKTPKGWGRSYDDLFIKVVSCGRLQWTCPAHHTIWAWLTDEIAKGLSSDALVETRIFPQWRGSWTYTLGVNVASDESNMGWPETQGRSCALEHDEERGILLTNRVTAGSASRSKSFSGLKLKGTTTLVLQSWREGDKHYCRLLPESGKPVLVESEIEGTMPKQGTIKLTLVNQEVVAPYVWFWIDYLRVYAGQ